MIEHVLLTRFNLATPGREEDIRNRPGWLSRRFDLFERYCLPSVASQVSQDFVWIVYFDVETPIEFRDRIDLLSGIYPFVPFYTGLFLSDGWRTSVRQVLDGLGKVPDNILTSRLDNDDALARNYISRVRSAAEQSLERHVALNITSGCVLSHGVVYQTQHHSNAFFSLLEPYDNCFRTAAAIRHMDLGSQVPLVQLDGPPGWLQVVHSENVSNRIRGSIVEPGFLSNLFFEELSSELVSTSRIFIVFDRFVLFPLRSAPDFFLKFARSIRNLFR
jgi:hypothetical protein